MRADWMMVSLNVSPYPEIFILRQKSERWKAIVAQGRDLLQFFKI